MNTKKLDLLLHPIRLRILSNIGGREMTSQQIAKLLPDVPVATLYRHINALYEGDLLTITKENPIRGTVEKVYAISDLSALNLSEEDFKDATKDDHTRFFTTYLFSLLADFTQYLQSKDELDFTADGVGYHTVPIYLSDEELITFSQQMQSLLQTYASPQKGRKQRKLSFVIMPTNNEED
jgi:DNA-binding transcriptional ArsR family regulator